MSDLGNSLKALRVARGYSLRELAKGLKTDHAYLHRIENGDKVPSHAFLLRLCTGLDIPSRVYVVLAEREVAKRWREGRKS